jgi:hypothetical protein
VFMILGLGSGNDQSVGDHNRRLIFGVPIRASLCETDSEPIPAAIQSCLNYVEENSMLQQITYNFENTILILF